MLYLPQPSEIIKVTLYLKRYMRIREKLISYQNKAEENFNNRKSIFTTLNFIAALFIFISSTIIACLSMPIRYLIKSASNDKGSLQIYEMNNQNIDQILKQERVVLLDFWADWCGPCIMMNPVIKDFANNTKNICVAKVNADSNKKIINDFKIKGLPQFVLIKDGTEIKRHAGPMTLSDLNIFCFA
jgi:thioredoxin 1